MKTYLEEEEFNAICAQALKLKKLKSWPTNTRMTVETIGENLESKLKFINRAVSCVSSAHNLWVCDNTADPLKFSAAVIGAGLRTAWKEHVDFTWQATLCQLYCELLVFVQLRNLNVKTVVKTYNAEKAIPSGVGSAARFVSLTRSLTDMHFGPFVTDAVGESLARIYGMLDSEVFLTQYLNLTYEETTTGTKEVPGAKQETDSQNQAQATS